MATTTCTHGAPDRSPAMDCTACGTRVCTECLHRRPADRVRPYNADHHPGVCWNCQPPTNALQGLLP